MKKFITIFLLSTFTLAQSGEDYTIIPNFKTGAGFGIFDKYNLCAIDGCGKYNVPPDIFIGFGTETAPLVNLYNAQLSLVLDTYYMALSTKVLMSDYGRTQFYEKHLPVMVSVKFKTKGTVVPFFKAGMGVEWMKMGKIEEFSNLDSYSGENWLFAYGMGCGIEINAVENLQIAVFVDMIVKPDGLIIKINRRRTQLDYDSRNSTTLAGVQIGYRWN